MVNREEMARRIARRGGYEVGEITKILKLYEDIFVEALESGEEVKQGKVFKVEFKFFPKKKAWNGIDKVYFTRPAKRVPKFKALSRIKDIEILVHTEEEEKE